MGEEAEDPASVVRAFTLNTSLAKYQVLVINSHLIWWDIFPPFTVKLPDEIHVSPWALL